MCSARFRKSSSGITGSVECGGGPDSGYIAGRAIFGMACISWIAAIRSGMTRRDCFMQVKIYRSCMRFALWSTQ